MMNSSEPKIKETKNGLELEFFFNGKRYMKGLRIVDRNLIPDMRKKLQKVYDRTLKHLRNTSL